MSSSWETDIVLYRQSSRRGISDEDWQTDRFLQIALSPYPHFFPAHGSYCPNLAGDWLDQGLCFSNSQISKLPILYTLKKRSVTKKKVYMCVLLSIPPLLYGTGMSIYHLSLFEHFTTRLLREASCAQTCTIPRCAKDMVHHGSMCWQSAEWAFSCLSKRGKTRAGPKLTLVEYWRQSFCSGEGDV